MLGESLSKSPATRLNFNAQLCPECFTPILFANNKSMVKMDVNSVNIFRCIGKHTNFSIKDSMA